MYAEFICRKVPLGFENRFPIRFQYNKSRPALPKASSNSFSLGTGSTAAARKRMISFGFYLRFYLFSHFLTRHAQLDGVGNLEFEL